MDVVPQQEAQAFSSSFTVARPPKEVFAAILDVRGWWSGDITGRTDQLGAEFTYRYRKLHRSTQRLTELVPERRVVWKVTSAVLTFVKDQDEWNGTELVFELFPTGKRTEVRFTHRGLVPSCECYRGCSEAWSFYIGDSLRRWIETGTGQPNPREP